MDVPVLADQQKLTVQKQDVVCKTCQEQWMIGTDGEKKSGKVMLSALLDENEDVFYKIYKMLVTAWVF